MQECTRAIEKYPRSADSLHHRALLRFKQRKLDAALADVQRAVEISPDDGDTLGLRAFLLAEQGRLDEADRDCAALGKAGAVGWGPLRSCAWIARKRGDTKAALERVGRILAEAPDDLPSLLERSRALHEAGDLDAESADLEHVLRLQPGNAEALNDLAWLRVLGGDHAGAREDAEKSLALRPDNAYALGTRCFALAGLGLREGARKDCARAVALRPGSLIDRGMLAFLDGRRSKAVQLWNEAVKERPSASRELAPWIAKAKGR